LTPGPRGDREHGRRLCHVSDAMAIDDTRGRPRAMFSYEWFARRIRDEFGLDAAEV
jgi:hypothetical protein